jgi:hypothetical protein
MAEHVSGKGSAGLLSAKAEQTECVWPGRSCPPAKIHVPVSGSSYGFYCDCGPGAPALRPASIAAGLSDPWRPAHPPIASGIAAILANDAVRDAQFQGDKASFAKIKASLLILGAAA